ncbi:MAG: ABC transporter ATP-binding protein [Acidobacteria bacterium]|nr:ABC transporter ATP-binding protein [Acidobacteriota bacterium]
MHHMGWGSYIRFDDSEPRPNIDRATLKRVLSYASSYKIEMGVVLVTIVVISILTVVPPLLMKGLIDTAIPDKNLTLVTLLGLGMVAVPLINGIVGVVQRRATAGMGEGVIFDLRGELYDHLQGMSLGFFTNTKTGELMSRLNNDVVGAQQAVTGTFVSLVANILGAATVLAVMFGLEWRLTLLAVAMLPLFIFLARRVGKLLGEVARSQMDASAAMNAHMQETLSVSGSMLVKLFGRNDDERSRFSGNAGTVRDLGIRRAMIGRWFFVGIGIVSALGTAAVFWVGSVMVINDIITVGTIVALSAYLGQLYGLLSGLSNARVEFETALVSFERVFEVIDLPHDIEEAADPITLDRVHGKVELSDVWFRYSDSSQGLQAVKRYGWRGVTEVDDPDSRMSSDGWTLKGVTLAAEPGQLVALVGPSGAGKTTTTYLVPRLYDASEGTVTIDGYDVRTLSFDTVAAAVGVVTQEPYLFHDTIANNIRYAKPQATDEEIRDAARIANIDEFIMGLPLGYDTKVGERGYRLSGGEKQRVAIARVLLKDPRILILDEATSHLDAANEAMIQEALKRVMEGRTSLVIAHRLSTILAADEIFVIDHGEVVESGTHEELRAKGGLYAGLYETQFADSRVRAAVDVDHG